MLIGLLSLLEAVNKIYRIPYVNMILISMQIAMFCRSNKKMLQNDDIYRIICLAIISLVIYWIASPALTTATIIAAMIPVLWKDAESFPALMVVAALVFWCSIIQLAIPCSGPHILCSLYSTISQTNLLESLYMNIKEKSIVERNPEILNSDTFLYYLSTCIPLLFLNTGISEKLISATTLLLVTQNRMQHAYHNSDRGDMWSEKITNSCTWLHAKSIEGLVNATPLQGLLSHGLVALASVNVANLTEPDKYNKYKKLKVA